MDRRVSQKICPWAVPESVNLPEDYKSILLRLAKLKLRRMKILKAFDFKPEGLLLKVYSEIKCI